MTGSKKAGREWKTIKRFRLQKGEVLYHLRRTNDGSTWLAMRIDRYHRFIANMLNRIEKMEALLNAIGSDRTKVSSSLEYVDSR